MEIILKILPAFVILYLGYDVFFNMRQRNFWKDHIFRKWIFVLVTFIYSAFIIIRNTEVFEGNKIYNNVSSYYLDTSALLLVTVVFFTEAILAIKASENVSEDGKTLNIVIIMLLVIPFVLLLGSNVVISLDGL